MEQLYVETEYLNQQSSLFKILMTNLKGNTVMFLSPIKFKEQF